MPSPLAVAAPWLILPPLILLRLSRTKHLTEESTEPPSPAPKVSIICPARDEAHNIETFVRMALQSTWPNLELIVVDDHSTDGTGDLARAAGAGDPRLRVISPPPLADGWFGKQWACHAGAAQATGEIFLFTDADTKHGPELVVRSINAMRARGSDLLSVAGGQEMVTLAEKLIQPAIFASLMSMYGGTEEVNRSTNPRRKIGNGQCFFVRAEVYRELGGHEPTRSYVVEDLMIAQQWCAAGKQVHLIGGLEYITTRMYRGFNEIVAGWTKNIWAGGRHVLPPIPLVQWIVRVTFPLPSMLAWFPFVLLVLGLTGVLAPWATTAGAIGYLSVSFWLSFVFPPIGLSRWFALLHPIGGMGASYIYAVAAWNGDKVSWKGRSYTSD